MPASLRARRWARDLLRLTALCALIEVILLAIWVTFQSWQPLSVLLRQFVFGFFFAYSIGGLAWIVMPRVAPRVWPLHPLFCWAVLIVTLLACAVAGTGVASLLVYSLGILNGASVWAIFWGTLRTAVLITLIAGVFTTMLKSAEGRLHETELELRTQQLERERAEKLAAEAQLASLSSRVQPHFLFNTLNSISALVRGNPAEAEQMIERLSSLLRASLDGAQTVSLEQELRLVADYLEIQHTRFGDRLRYKVSLDHGAGASVPPFAVQSVVENALKHVAGRRQEGVRVEVSARRAGDDLLVDVTDDGPGFDPDAMKAGHGLDTLQGRLHALYGDRAMLEFLRQPGAMTVRLRVPAT